MPEAYLNVTNPEYASGTPEYLFSGLGEADSASLHCMYKVAEVSPLPLSVIIFFSFFFFKCVMIRFIFPTFPVFESVYTFIFQVFFFSFFLSPEMCIVQEEHSFAFISMTLPFFFFLLRNSVRVLRIINTVFKKK